ncbi:MAG: transglutaminase-like domain-containing protein [bacterium]|nr:transglutaminase-like domain-containing protein [bacterium]
MPTINPHPRFETTWRVVTYLLVFIGFLAMVFTGAVHPIVTTLFVMMWAYGLFHPSPPHWWRGWMTWIVFWACLTALMIDAYVARYDSILYLLLFLGIYKCLNLRLPLDHLHCLIIAFFMFLVCSIVTASAVFVLFMLFFILLANLELMCFTINNGSGAGQPYGLAGWHKPAHSSLRVSRHFLGRLAFSSLFITVAVLGLSFFLFLIIPHYAVEAFENPWGSPLMADNQAATSGYTDDLRLDGIDRIGLDETRVMSVRVNWIGAPERKTYPTGLRLRGTSLDSYDATNQRWSHTGREKTSQRWTEVNVQTLDTGAGPVLEQRIQQNIILTNRMFGAPTPFRFEFPQQAGLRLSYEWPSMLRAAQAFDNSLLVGNIQLSYVVYSHYADEASPLLTWLMNHTERRGRQKPQRVPVSPAELGLLDYIPPAPLVGGLTLPNRERLLNTQIPGTEFGDRIVELSRQVALGDDPVSKVVQLHDWFQNAFEYSLSPDTPKGMNPIEAFLFRTRRGHCEYFASSFALLARAQQIPTRVVIGYYTSEWDPVKRQFLVRQSDAHAWAEVWIEGWGWLTVDPTPPQMRGRSSLTAEVPTSWNRLGTTLGNYWRRYILDYSQIQQQRFIHGVLASPFGRYLHRSFVRMDQAKKNFSRHWDRDKGLSPKDLPLLEIVGALAGLAGLVGFGFGLRALLRRHRKRTVLPRSSVAFMNQLLARLERRGWRRRTGQTTAEFLDAVDRQTDGRWNLTPLLELYHRVRFAGVPLSPVDRAFAFQALRRIR